MPLKRCTNSEGKKGWSWGDGGCQVAENDKESKKQAIRVGLKVSGPKKFGEIMKREKGSLHEDELRFVQELTKADQPNYLDRIVAHFTCASKEDEKKKKDKAATNPLPSAQPDFLSADDGMNDTGKNLLSEKNEDEDTTDVRDGESSMDGYRPKDKLKKAVAPNVGVSPEEMSYSTEGALDTPVENVGMNIIVPPFNPDAAPELSPEKEVPDYEPPTRQEMTPEIASDFTEGPVDAKDEKKKKDKANMYNDSEMDSESLGSWDDPTLLEYISVAFISTDVRNHLDPSDFADPSRKAFPVRDQNDLINAFRLLHHSDNPSEIKRNLIRIAHRKGLKLPAHMTHDAGCVM